MNRLVGFRQMATFRQPVEQTGSACRNRAWMIASPRMGAAPDDRLDRERAEALVTGENQLLERLVQGENLESILDGVCRMVEGIFSDSFVSIMLVNPDELAPADDFRRDSDLFVERAGDDETQRRIRVAMERGFQTRDGEMALPKMVGDLAER
jgi:hypothetical protein